MPFCLLFCLMLVAAPLSASAFEDDLAIDMGLDEPPASVETPAATPEPTLFEKAKLAVQKPALTGVKKKVVKKQQPEAYYDLLTKLRRKMYITLDDVDDWLNRTPDINTCYENGKTILIYMIYESNNAEAVSYLITKGADMQTHCTPAYDALAVAAAENDSAAVLEALITNDANVIAKDENQSTILMLAAASNPNPEIIRILIEYGLKPDTKNQFGFDALTLAAYQNEKLNIIQTLLESGADIDSRDNNGRTPLMAAAVHGRDDIMQYLIKQGADFKAVDNDGVSVLDYYNKRGYLTSLPFTVEEYATPSERLNKELDFISLNHRKYNDMLKNSIYVSDAESVSTMALANNPDIDILASNGCTTFLNAVANNNSRTVLEKLLEKGANINSTCHRGKTALMVTAIAAGDETALPQQVDKASFLIDNGIDTNLQDEDGNTALMYAAAVHAAPAFIELLIKGGAEINASNKVGETALMQAVKNNAPAAVINTLLQNGADPDLADTSDETPLWYGLRNKVNTEILLSLIAADSNLNRVDYNYDTPLLYAVKNNFPPEVIRQLLESGADPKITGADGLNAFDVLKQSRYFDETMQKRTKEHVVNGWN